MSIQHNNQEYINNLDKIVDEISSGHLSVFIGAGVSTSSGYVDWKGLMEPIISQLGINPNIDLTLAAQFYENKYYRHSISKLIYDEFNTVPKENSILKILGSLPISSYWTTNYDSLIEDTLRANPISKSVEIMLKKEDFKFHKKNCEATVYKMHGDKNSPDDAIITKNDYETYDVKREIFTKALSVELITNTFLFIGFSFSDPNLERILSVVKHTFDEKHQKIHYCFMRKVQQSDYTDELDFEQDANYQSLRIDEMRRCGIETILLDDFSQIDLCLSYIKTMLNHKRIFVSGSLQASPIRPKEISIDSKQASFIQHLAQHLSTLGYKLISGFGQNIGNYLLIGVCHNKRPYEIRNIHNMIEIYPLITQKDDTDELRDNLISNCRNFLTIFGKTEKDGDPLLENDGVIKEYRIAKEHNLTILPLGCTGYTSNIIWNKENITNLYVGTDIEEDWNNLNNKAYDKEEQIILNSVVSIIEYNYRKKQNELKEQLVEKLQSFTKLKKVFLSFHYKSSHKYADIIRKFILQTNKYIATEEEKIHEKADKHIITKWIDEKLQDTVATILIYDKAIFSSNYVKYELVNSAKYNNHIIVLSLEDDLCKAKEQIISNISINHNCLEIYKFNDIKSSQDIQLVLDTQITGDVILP